MLKTKHLLLQRKMKTDSQSLNQLTDIFLQRWGIQLNTYKDEFHRTDCYFTYNEKDWEVEVKKRRFNKNTYPTAIINTDKFIELCKRNAILVCMYNDCWGICKDVRKAFIKETKIFCNHCTDFPSNPEWGSKVELDLNAFKWYNYEEAD